MPRNWLSLLLLTTLLTAFILLWESPPSNFLRPLAEESASIDYPSTYLTGVTTTQYSSTGKLDYEFRADRLRYYQPNPARQTQEDYTLMDKPDFTFHNEQQQPWLVNAETGEANFDGSRLELSTNVRLWQTFANGEVAELISEHLVLKPQSQFAETSKPVIIRTANSVTESVGMKAFLAEDRIELLSNVRSVHDPVK